MGWLTIAVVLGAAGLLVVAVCVVRVALALKRLTREVRRLRADLETARGEPADERAVTARAAR